MSRRFRRRPPAWFWLALVVAIALLGRGQLHQAPPESGLPDEAVVSSIIDGQTLEVRPTADPSSIRVRLLGIKISDDAQARQWMMTNVVGHNIRIERDKRRRANDGAQLAYVYLGDVLINEDLIRRGYARHDGYPGDSENYARRLRKAALK